MRRSLLASDMGNGFARDLMGGILGFDTETAMLLSSPSQIPPSIHWKPKLISHYLMANK